MQQEYIACTSTVLSFIFPQAPLQLLPPLSCAETTWMQADLPSFVLTCMLLGSAPHLLVLSTGNHFLRWHSSWTYQLVLETQIASKKCALASPLLGLMDSLMQIDLLVPARVLEGHLLVFREGSLPIQEQYTLDSPSLPAFS